MSLTCVPYQKLQQKTTLKPNTLWFTHYIIARGATLPCPSIRSVVDAAWNSTKKFGKLEVHPVGVLHRFIPGCSVHFDVSIKCVFTLPEWWVQMRWGDSGSSNPAKAADEREAEDIRRLWAMNLTVRDSHLINMTILQNHLRNTKKLWNLWNHQKSSTSS